MKFRVHVTVRERGQTPFDSTEFKSEDYDDLTDFATAVSQATYDQILNYLEGEEDDGSYQDFTD